MMRTMIGVLVSENKDGIGLKRHKEGGLGFAGRKGSGARERANQRATATYGRCSQCHGLHGRACIVSRQEQALVGCFLGFGGANPPPSFFKRMEGIEMENEMNCLTRRGVLIKNPMWWIEEIKINGEVVDNPELPLGDVGNIKPDALEYSIYRIFWLTLSKLTKFMQENKIEWKIKLYDRGCLSVTWDNKEGKYKVDREKL